MAPAQATVGDRGADDVSDPDLREEIELVAALAAAARTRTSDLPLREIDRLLGLADWT